MVTGGPQRPLHQKLAPITLPVDVDDFGFHGLMLLASGVNWLQLNGAVLIPQGAKLS